MRPRTRASAPAKNADNPNSTHGGQQPQHGFYLTNHVCGVCFGRVLVTALHHMTVYACADCGRNAEAHIANLCACGTKYPNGRAIGIKCKPNPNISPMSPCQFIAGE